MAEAPLPPGFVLEGDPDIGGSPEVPPGFVVESSVSQTPIAPSQPDWHMLAAQEIQRQNINPNLPSDLSQAKAIENAYAQQYAGGPSMSVQMAQEQQAIQNQANAQRGVVASNLIEALHPAGELMARGERMLAPAVGIVAPNAAANMRANAQQLEQTRGNGGLTSLPGQIVGSLPTFATPLVAAASGANRAYTETEQENATGAEISGWKEFIRVAGQGIIDAALSKVFSAKPGTAPIAGKLEQILASRLQQIGPQLLAKYGAKGAVGAIANELGNEAGNLLFERPLGTGAVESAAIGGALPIAHEAAGNMLSRLRGRTQVPEEISAPKSSPPSGFIEETAPEPGTPLATEPGELIYQPPTPEERLVSKAEERPQAMPPEQLDPRIEKILNARTEEEATRLAQELVDTTPPEPPDLEQRKADEAAILGPQKLEIPTEIPEVPPETSLSKMRARQGAIALPNVRGALDYGRDIIREVGKITGSDIGLTKTGVKAANDIRGLYGEQDRRAAILEDAIKPHAKLAEGLPEAHVVRLVDELSAGQPPSDPRFQQFADEHRKLAAGYESRAKALGWDTSKWTPDWIGRMFEFPDAKGKFRGDTGYSAKLAGSEGYLKGRTFDTYQEALNAVKKVGGRPKYANPITMALAKDIEVSNSLLAHEQFEGFLKRGDVREVKKNTPIQSGESLIRDPLRWTHSDTRQFAAPKDIADLLNHVSSESTGSKIADAVTGANRLATRIQMAINLRHYITESLGATQQLYGQAFKDLFRGQFKQAGKELIQGTPLLGTTASVVKGIKLEPASVEALAIAKGGGDVGQGRSILQDSDWKAMHEAWANGEGLKAGKELVGNVLGFANKVLFEKYIPNLRKGVAAVLAESEIANARKQGRSLSSPEFKDVMNKHIQTISNMLGVEDSRIHFQNKTAATVGRMLFGLPNWFLGKARFTTDAIRGMAPLFKGKNADPATYGALGAIATTGVVGSALYAAFNGGKMPTSWNDLRHVPTPWTGDDGKPIRITVPYPWEMISDVATGERSIPETLHNRLSPLMKFAEEMYAGKDFRGAPTHETWGDVAKSLRDTLATPYSVSGFNRSDLSPGFKVAALAGITPSAKKFGQSAAERFAYETIQSKQPEAPKTHEEIAKQDARSAILKALRKDDYGPLETAIDRGYLTPAQGKVLVRSAQQPRGLPNLIESHELTHRDLMTIWDKATPAEKHLIHDPLYSRLAKETSLPANEKERLLNQLDQEVARP